MTILALCLASSLTSCTGNETKTDDTTPETDSLTEQAQEFAELEGVYFSKIYMTETQSVDLYLKISADGSFVFARGTDFENSEKGSGKLGKTESGENAFFYTAINGSQVNKGEKTSTYTIDKDGSVCFTSTMWFGSTAPKITNDDGTISYPVFTKYDPSSSVEPKDTETTNVTESTSTVPADTNAPEETKKPETTTVPETTKVPEQTKKPETTTVPEETKKPETTAPAETKPSVTEPTPTFSEGTYTGSLTKFVDAMNSNVKYDISISFNNGTYEYKVKVTLSGGMDYTADESCSGTYTLNGDKLSMSGKMSEGTIYGTSVTLKGYLSSFAGSEETVTVFK